MHTECRSTRVLSGYSRPAILVLAVLLSGCALFQPYRNVTAYPPDSKPQWQDINSAAQICRVYLDYPPLSIHAVRVDLQAQNLNIAVYPLAPSEAGEGTSLSKKVSTFAKENHCFVAVNANPFAPSSATEGDLRTITGICVANGNTVILIVIDGRTSESVGATEEEVALWMRYFGADDAITLDGGGSSAMAILDGTIVLENVPVHGNVPGVERAVATCIGFALRE
ncbi:MAG TPA: hypothetical protein DHU26_08810 [Spirochaetaceae bacterium]|jgi:Exopolysaccharide biosynthesis protein related to N-acetylglucosamine-1-phosphodiester alpha-N-acetylglucosaminidase|nr:hypothetical protein [Spirochaetaceae bacterium]